MNNASLAKEANDYARGAVKEFKSSNKYVDERIDSNKKLRRFTSANLRDGIARDRPVLGFTMKQITAYGKSAIGIKAGNCGEMSAIACLYLSRHKEQSVFDYVSLASPGDHAFVVIGQPPPPGGVYPKNFADWDDEAWICDPWANTYCQAAQYPEQWVEKLKSWATKGKQLAVPVEGVVGQFEIVDPTHPDWLNAITKNDKLSIVHSKKSRKQEKTGSCIVM